MIKMKREDGGGASFDGAEYEPNAKGIITVPGKAVEELRAHGFEVVKDDSKDDEPEDPAEKLARLKKDVKNLKAAVKRAPEDAEKKAALDAAILALETFTGKTDDTEE